MSPFPRSRRRRARRYARPPAGSRPTPWPRRPAATSPGMAWPRMEARPALSAVDVEQIGRADEIGDEGVGRLAVDLDRRGGLADAALPITTTRSAMVIASRWSWVTTIVVMPSCCCSWRSSTCMASRSLASSADSGSSSRNSFGESASARAIATRCRWPPESLATGRSAKPGRWTIFSSSSTRLACSSLRGAADAQRIGDVVADRQMREQRQRLEHHAEIALVRRHRRDVLAVEHDRAGGRLLEPGDHAAAAWSCRSRTGRAGRRTCRAARERLIVVDGLEVAELLGDVLDGQSGHDASPVPCRIPPSARLRLTSRPAPSQLVGEEDGRSARSSPLRSGERWRRSEPANGRTTVRGPKIRQPLTRRSARSTSGSSSRPSTCRGRSAG